MFQVEILVMLFTAVGWACHQMVQRLLVWDGKIAVLKHFIGMQVII